MPSMARDSTTLINRFVHMANLEFAPSIRLPESQFVSTFVKCRVQLSFKNARLAAGLTVLERSSFCLRNGSRLHSGTFRRT